MCVLTLDHLGYSYGERFSSVFQNICYQFEKGKVYSIVGRSGAGKTTLLSLLSGLAKPTSGKILFEGNDIAEMDKYRYRSQYVGVVFQSFNLLPHLTALENVRLSMDLSGKKYKNKNEYALRVLQSVELDETKAKRRILKLSGGEQQRVAIARALSYHPEIILADEPTGNLDGETQDQIMAIFQRLAHQDGKCVILVTHSPAVAKASDEIYQLSSK